MKEEIISFFLQQECWNDSLVVYIKVSWALHVKGERYYFSSARGNDVVQRVILSQCSNGKFSRPIYKTLSEWDPMDFILVLLLSNQNRFLSLTSLEQLFWLLACSLWSSHKVKQTPGMWQCSCNHFYTASTNCSEWKVIVGGWSIIVTGPPNTNYF